MSYGNDSKQRATDITQDSMETPRDVLILLSAPISQHIGSRYQSCIDLTMRDRTWLLSVVWAVLLCFQFRSFLLASLCGVWKSLENDINAFCLQHFIPSPSHVLPRDMTAISTDDVDALNRFADANFEKRNKTIIGYPEVIRSRSRDITKRVLSKEDVTDQFTLAVLREYASTEPACLDLVDQINT